MLEHLIDVSKVESPPRMEGKQMTALLAPKGAAPKGGGGGPPKPKADKPKVAATPKPPDAAKPAVAPAPAPAPAAPPAGP